MDPEYSSLVSPFYSGYNGISVCTYTHIDGYNMISFVKSSVTESFWKVFWSERNGSIERSYCIFIPDHRYLKSCIILRDLEALRVCKEWLEYLKSFDDIANYYSIYEDDSDDDNNYNNDDTELIESIPEVFLMGKIIASKRRDSNHDIFNEICNFNPISLSLDSNSEVECCDMLSYHIALNCGAQPENIRIVINDISGPEMIKFAAQNPTLIKSIDIPDATQYIVDMNKEYETMIWSVCDQEGFSRFVDYPIIDGVINKYGCLDKAPLHVKIKLCEKAFKHEVYEYDRPTIKYLSTFCPIISRSAMFHILFPDIPTNTNSDMSGYGPKAVDCSKQEFLKYILESYSTSLISKLYELFIIGFITKEDIIESGLDNVYTVCRWMVNRSSKTKSARK